MFITNASFNSHTSASYRNGIIIQNELSVICCHTINFAVPVTPQVVAEAIINCNLYDGMTVYSTLK